MKQLFFMMLLLITSITANAQQYTVRKDATGHTVQLKNDSILLLSRQPLYKSGKFLKKSASFDMMSLGFAAVSAIAYAGMGINEDNRTACITIGTVFAVGALASRIVAITYKNKAGKELELSAGRVVLRF